MKKAAYADKNLIIDILVRSFDANASVNYIIKQDKNRKRRIVALMDYSFEVCKAFGDVFISDDNKACALIVYPDKKKTTLLSICLNIQLILRGVGVQNIRRAIGRESLLRKTRRKQAISCLWFIGVDPQEQYKGFGSKLLNSIIEYSHRNGRPIYLETSNKDNLPWYKKFSFQIYAEKDLGHTLYFLRRESEK